MRGRRGAAAGSSALTRTALGAVVAALVLVCGAQASPAAASTSGCKSGYFCLWADTDYSGPGKGTSGSVADLRKSSFNDVASSWYNHTSKYYCVYTDIGFAGAGWMFKPGTSSRYQASWNDKTSSIRPALWHQTSTVPGMGYWSCF